MAERTARNAAAVEATGQDAAAPQAPPVVVKKYANRRLYNTATSSYVTLDYLAQMVRNGTEFTVEDAKTGEDITRSVLTQIIVEEEGKGQSLLPINFLRQVISFYGDNLQVLLPRYLDQSMELFGRNQEQMRAYMKETFGGMFPFARFEEMSKQNLALFERAMTMFTPFKPEAKATESAAGTGKEVQLDAVRHQVEALQRQLETLTRQIGEKNPK